MNCGDECEGEGGDDEDSDAAARAFELRLAVPLLWLELEAGEAAFSRLFDLQPLAYRRIGSFGALCHLRQQKVVKNQVQGRVRMQGRPRLDVRQDP